MPWRDTFKANLISDDAWMDMLKVRNELAHDYDYEIVKKHCNTIVEKYIDLFYEFEKTVKKLFQKLQKEECDNDENKTAKADKSIFN